MEKMKLNLIEVEEDNIILLPSVKSEFSRSADEGKKDELLYGDIYFSVHFKYCYCVLAEIKESAFHFFTMYLWEKESTNERKKIKNIYNFNQFAKDLKKDKEAGYIYLGNVFFTPLKEIYLKLFDIYKKYEVNFDEVNFNCSLGKELFDIFYYKKSKRFDVFFVQEYQNHLKTLEVYFPEEDYSLSIGDILFGDTELLDKIKNNQIMYFVKLYYDIDRYDKNEGEYISMLQFINYECGNLNLKEYRNEKNRLECICVLNNYGSATLFDLKRNKELIDDNDNELKGKIFDYLTKLRYNFEKRTIKPTLEKLNEIVYYL